MIASRTIGKITAGETLVEVLPHVPYSGSTVIMVHGAEGAANGASAWMGYPTRIKIPAATVLARKRTLSPELGGNFTWGNPLSQTRMDQAYAYAGTNKVILCCQSMGGVTGLNWAANNPSKIAGIVLVIPVINLADVRDNSTYQAEIDAAYGGRFDPVTHADSNPLVRAQAGAFNGLPIQCWYGITDTLCKSQFAQQFIAASGAIDQRLTGGHEEETVARVDSDKVAEFIRNL